MMPPFLVNGYDGDCPIQAYCSVISAEYMIVDTIYPHPNISISVNRVDTYCQFGDNPYTRKTVIRELIKLDSTFHAVKHFYHRYRAALKAYTETEVIEYDHFNQLKFSNTEERENYYQQMCKRLKDTYISYLQRAIPEVPIKADSDWVIPPYLLHQILAALDVNYKR